VVAGDQGQIGVLDDALHAVLRRGLEDSVDLFLGGLAAHLQHHVHNRDIGGGDAQSDAAQLALDLGVDQGHSLGSTGAGGNDVHRSGTGTAQVTVGGIEDALVTGVAVGGGHRAFDDAEGLIQDLDHRRHAVGGAAGVAEDVVVLVAVLIGVHAHHEGADFVALTRGGQDHFLGAGLEVLAGTDVVVEDTGGFDDQIHAPLLPGEVGGVAVIEGLDRLAVDDDRVLGGGHLCITQGAKHRVVLEQVGVGVGVTGAVDADNLDAGIASAAQPATHEVATDAAESVDRNLQGHGISRADPLTRGIWPPIIQKLADPPHLGTSGPHLSKALKCTARRGQATRSGLVSGQAWIRHWS